MNYSVNRVLLIRTVLYNDLEQLFRVTRYTVHGRGAKHGPVEHIVSVWIHSSSWRHQRQFNRVWFLHPFLPVKSHVHFLNFFPKKSFFFRPKKGSLNRPIPVANASLGGSTFRTPKNRCVKLPVGRTMRGPSISPSQKSIIFRRTKNEEERRTFQI